MGRQPQGAKRPHGRDARDKDGPGRPRPYDIRAGPGFTRTSYIVNGAIDAETNEQSPAD